MRAAFAHKCRDEGEAVNGPHVCARGKEVDEEGNSGGVGTLFEQSFNLVAERGTLWAVV